LIVGRGGLIAQVGLCLYCVHLAWQLRQLDAPTPPLALRLFRSNWYAGLILFFGFALEGWARQFLAH
jgi:4-hydroxybenzoate polyprenyltransferase